MVIDDSDESPDDEWTNLDLRYSIAESSIVRVRIPNSTLFFGKGKLEEVKHAVSCAGPSVLFINHLLSSNQFKTLEQWALNRIFSAENVKVVDRFGVILRIFSERARTSVAKLQLELAWLRFAKSRLTRGKGQTIASLLSVYSGPLKQYCLNRNFLQEVEIVSAKGRGNTHKLSGEGETQLEIEKRLISDREAKIRSEVARVKSLKKRRFKDESLKNYPTFALIGYTNAGKTALMNYFTGADLLSENLLFQTLGTTVRKLLLPSGQFGVILDTVGFITDLPHNLIESFKETLEGVQQADVIVHIRDISSPFHRLQKKTVFDVLREIEFPQEQWSDKYLEVWNKVDLIEDGLDLEELNSAPYPIVPLSALYGINCTKLLDAMDVLANKVKKKAQVELKFPLREFNDRMNWLCMSLSIRRPDYSVNDKDEVCILVYIDPTTLNRYISLFGSSQCRIRLVP